MTSLRYVHPAPLERIPAPAVQLASSVLENRHLQSWAQSRSSSATFAKRTHAVGVAAVFRPFRLCVPAQAGSGVHGVRKTSLQSCSVCSLALLSSLWAASWRFADTVGYGLTRRLPLTFLLQNLGFYRFHASLNQQLFEQSQTELAEFERAWEVREIDITLLEKVAEGAFGEVWSSEWQEVCIPAPALC